MKTIAVGTKDCCLLEHEVDFYRNKIEQFQEYLVSRRKNLYSCQNNVEASAILLYLTGIESRLEIVGAYAGACVAATINVALRLGISTRSPERFLFYLDADQDLAKTVSFYTTVPQLTGAELLVNLGLCSSTLDFTYSFDNGVHLFVPD